MDFSEIFSSVTFAVFSPDSQQLLLSNGKSIIIKHVQSLSTLAFTQSNHESPISQVDYSPDSRLIAITWAKKGLVEIRKAPSHQTNDPQNMIAKIEKNNLEGVKWCPDSVQLLVWAELQQKISIYNLLDKSTSFIRNPKFNQDKGVSFSQCGQFMVLPERNNAKDYIGIYATKDWKLLNYQPVDTNDLTNLTWGPNDNSIAIWDNEIYYRIVIHCPYNGQLMKFQPYDYALGIKSVQYSGKGNMIAIGSYDEKIRIINTVSMRLITEFEHKAVLNQYKDIVVIYKEEEYKDNFVGARIISKYINVDPQNLKIPSLKIQSNQANPLQGISVLAWSHDDEYLASKNDNMPNVLWIWHIHSLELKYVLIQLSPIKHFKWNSGCSSLVLCTGMNKIYFWSPQSTSVCDLPYQKLFNVQKIEWTQDQKCLLLLDKNDIVVAYPQMDVINRQQNLNENDQ